MTRVRAFGVSLLAVVLCGIGKVQAAPFQYAARLTVFNTGNDLQGKIAAGDIELGDAFTMTLWIDPFVEQTGTNGATAVFSTNVLLSLTAVADGGNSGTFAPEIFGFTGTAEVFADPDDADLTLLAIGATVQSAATVNYTAWQADIYNDEGVSPFSEIGFIFYLDTPFANGGAGTSLGSYFPGAEGGVLLDSAALYFDPGNSVPPMAAIGTTTAVPEPSTLVMLGLGGVLAAILRRRARAQG